MKPSQLFEGKNSSLYKTFMKTKKNTIKGVKAWALIHEGHIFPTSIFYRKKDAVKEKCEWNKLTPVLITPITKVVKNKVGK